MVWTKPIKLCGFSNTKYTGACFGTSWRIEKQPVFLSNTECTKCSFTSRVINRNFTVFKKYTKILFLIYTVIQSLCCLSFRKCSRKLFLDPFKIFINQRLDIGLALFEALFRSQIFEPVIEFIYGTYAYQCLISNRFLDRLRAFVASDLYGVRIVSPRMRLIRELE